MNQTRRQFLSVASAGVVGAVLASKWAVSQEPAAKLRLGACDWSLRAGGPEGLATAKAVGLDGLEISAGGPTEAGAVEVADAGLRQRYKDARTQTGVAIPSIAMGFLNNKPLATEDNGVAWLEQTIDAAQDLGTPVILLAFFGKGDLRDDGVLNAGKVDSVVGKLKEVAARAEKAGVPLGLENTLSAEQNLAIVERVQSDAVRIYYDVCNSTNNGYDVPAEIRLMKDRMCQVHFKDGGHYLGEGDVKMPPVAEALNEIGYKGWIVLETSIPSKDRDADFKRNAEFVKKLMGMA